MKRGVPRWLASAGIGAMLLACPGAGGAAAQAPPAEDHEQHHPPGGTPAPQAPLAPSAPAKTAPSATPAPTGEMSIERMMKEMERMMGGPAKKPLAGRLLDVERLSEAERNSLKGDAGRQKNEGLGLLREAGRELEQARARGDRAAMEGALGKLREGATLWETGDAVEQALAHPAPQARAAAVRWFKAQMNVDARPPIPTGLPWGLAWLHLAVMAALALFTVGAITLYLYRVRRALGLLARLTRREGPR